MATAAQIASNLENSRASTGPRSPEGKNASKRNSVKHGLAGSGGVVPEGDRAAVEARLELLLDEFRPRTDYERTLIDQMAVDSIRLDRCRDTFFVLCEDQTLRAEFFWDEDRRAEAETIAARLGWDPARSRSQLARDRFGCQILIERWDELGRILRDVGDWDDAQRSMALDLLGTPLELRAGTTAVDHPADTKAFRIALVDRELARLRERKVEALDPIDALDRESARTGVGVELSKPLRLLQRYEAACFRRNQIAIRYLRDRPPLAEPLAARPIPQPPVIASNPAAPKPKPRKKFEPPIRPPGSKSLLDMTFDELFELYDIPEVPTGPRRPMPAGL